MAIFGQIFRLFEPLVFITQKGVFFVVDCRKTHFPGLFCLKEKLERWLFLDQNHELPLWKHLNFSSFLFPCFSKCPFLIQNHRLTPLEKSQFLDSLNFLFFQPRKAFFSFQNIVKHIFFAYIAKRNTLDKWPFFDQNHRLTPSEKTEFFNFEDFFFLQPRKAFCFVLQYRKTHFPALYCPPKKM